MGIKETAQDAGWSVRWSLREAAWDVEERVLWRGTDAARATTEKALKNAEPVHRLIQTRLAWPITDAWRDGSTTMRTGLATAAVAAVAATGALASNAVMPDAPGAPAPKVASAETSMTVAGAVSDQELQGVTPDFVSNTGQGTSTVASNAVDPAEPAKKVVPPPAGAPATEVASAFAEAFVRYEVGDVDDSTTATFEAVAQQPLVESLAQDPPRLPAGDEVPKAEVMNVVLGEKEGKRVEASVSLVRLQAASELRLTLQDTPDGWQVVGVRG